MGRMALMIVLGLSLTVGIIGYTLNKSKTGTVENVSGFDKYTIARNIAHTGVNLMLRAFDRNDSTYINPVIVNKQTALMVVNAMSGKCSVFARLKNPSFLDTLEIESRSRFMDSTRIMKLMLKRYPVPFPLVNAAVSLRVPNVDFEIGSASALIDGRDHDMSGAVVSGPNDKPGVSVFLPSDTTKVIAAEASKPGEQILGTRDVAVDTAMENPVPYINDYAAAADFKYTGPTVINNTTWGSASAPVIVYCEGSTGEVKTSGNVKGWGIMVVKGNLRITGNFEFYGLIIAYNDVTLIEDVVFGTGTPKLYGGLIAAGGATSDFKLTGNNLVGYSKQALYMAQFINKLQAYRVLRWYE